MEKSHLDRYRRYLQSIANTSSVLKVAGCRTTAKVLGAVPFRARAKVWVFPIEIWHWLEQQKIQLIQLNRRIRALLEVLKIKPRLFDSYRTTYKDLGSSNVILEHEAAIRAIQEKNRHLSGPAEVACDGGSDGPSPAKPAANQTSK